MIYCSQKSRLTLKDITARIEATTQKLHRTLDRLTDHLDDDEYAFYSQQRDTLKALLQEYREEYEIASKKRVTTQVDQAIIEDFAAMGKAYEETLRTSTDFTFWRGLVDDLDIEGIIGTEEDRRYIDFVVFGKPRMRAYLEGGPPSNSSNEKNVSVLHCCSTRWACWLKRSSTTFTHRAAKRSARINKKLTRLRVRQ
jgi:uncharacterized protein (DUF4415 family)